MTESGDPKDNAVAERQNNTVKNELLKDIKFHSIGEVRRAMEKAVAFYNNERPHMSLNNMTPRQAASCTGKIQKKWISYREKHLENLEIQEGACTFAPQTLNMIERLSAEPIQQKQGLRENHSTFARVKDYQLLPGLRIKVSNKHSTYGRVKVKSIQLFLGKYKVLGRH